MDLSEILLSSTDTIFSLLPDELLTEHVLKHVTPSSLLLLSMTSTEFYKRSVSELEARYAEDYTQIIGENGCHINGDGKEFDLTKNFLHRVWPTSDKEAVSCKLKSALDFICDLYQKKDCRIEDYIYFRDNFRGTHIRVFSTIIHFRGCAKLTQTFLKFMLASSVHITASLLKEVPWKLISEFGEGKVEKLSFGNFSAAMCDLLIYRRYDLLQNVLADNTVRGIIDPYLPMSRQFLETLVETGSLDETFKGHNSREHYGARCYLTDVFLLSLRFPVERMVDIFHNAYRNFENLHIFTELLREGYTPELTWFDIPKFFPQDQMNFIKKCITTSEFSSLNDEIIETALCYALVLCRDNKSHPEESDSLIRSIIGGRNIHLWWGISLLAEMCDVTCELVRQKM